MAEHEVGDFHPGALQVPNQDFPVYRQGYCGDVGPFVIGEDEFPRRQVAELVPDGQGQFVQFLASYSTWSVDRFSAMASRTSA